MSPEGMDSTRVEIPPREQSWIQLVQGVASSSPLGGQIE